MRPRSLLVTAVIVLTLSASALPAGADPSGPQAPAAALGAGFTYQGQLKTSGAPVNGSCDFQFNLWDAAGSGTPPTGGLQIGVTQSALALPVANGLFTAPIDFGSGAFTGSARWLAIAVRCPPGSGLFTPLSPRQPLTPAPYALALPGLYTVDNGGVPNVVGGYEGNSVGAAVNGSVIGGGGAPGNGCLGPCSNRIIDNYATIAGGFGNLAGNGGAAFETVGGGAANTASADSATVAGGNENTASQQDATVGGGRQNVANAFAATVPGGEYNVAQGDFSLAAGRNAHADHAGAFVWADFSTTAALHSTANNQFLVRAAGGVGVNTDSPAAALDVHGTASGTLRVSTGATTGTILAAVQAGTAQLGTGNAGVNVFTITFPSAFSAVPHVVISVRNDDAQANLNDTFLASTRHVNSSTFVVNVIRMDPPFAGTGWGQPLQLDWAAWQ